jgi:hypothetical protein
VQLAAAVGSIKGHAAKMHASWSSCRPDAIGGADLDAYRWAHTVSPDACVACIILYRWNLEPACCYSACAAASMEVRCATHNCSMLDVRPDVTKLQVRLQVSQ